MKKIILIFLLIFLVSYGLSNKEKDTLLRLIQGLYKDKVYELAAKKSLEYIKQVPKEDPYREKVIKILFYSFYKAKDKNEFLKNLNLMKEVSPTTAKEIFSLGIKLFEKEPLKKAVIIKTYMPYADKYRKKELLKLLAILYIEAKAWNEILKLPENKDINIYKVIALYKLKKYKELLKYTEEMSKFSQEDKDKVLYYRGLSFLKLGKKEKAVKEIEAITFKTPEMIKFLSTYYVKKKDYINAERYLKMLTTEKEYKDYAYYLLGTIEDISKNYKKAIQYYKKAAVYNTKYGQLAIRRLQQFAKAGIYKNKFYTVRIVLYSKKSQAESLIKRKNLKECYIKKYKKYYGVFCGKFVDKNQAQKLRKKLIKKGFKDAVINAFEE